MFASLILGLGLMSASAQDACDSAMQRLEFRYPEQLEEANSVVPLFNAAMRTARALEPTLEACTSDANVVYPSCANRDLWGQTEAIRDELSSVRFHLDEALGPVRALRRDHDNACRGMMNASHHANNIGLLDELIEFIDGMRTIVIDMRGTLIEQGNKAYVIYDAGTEPFAGMIISGVPDERSELIARGEAYRAEGLSRISLPSGTAGANIYEAIELGPDALQLRERPASSWTHDGITSPRAPRLDFQLTFLRTDAWSATRYEIDEPLLELTFSPALIGDATAPSPGLHISCRNNAPCIRAEGDGGDLSNVYIASPAASEVYERLIALQFSAQHDTSTRCTGVTGRPTPVDRVDACFQTARVHAYGLDPVRQPWPARARVLYGQQCYRGLPEACAAFIDMIDAGEGGDLESAMAFARQGCEEGSSAMCAIVTDPAINRFPGAEHAANDRYAIDDNCTAFGCYFISRVRVDTGTGPETYRSEKLTFDNRYFDISVAIANCDTREIVYERWFYSRQGDPSQGEQRDYRGRTSTFIEADRHRFCEPETGEFTFLEARERALEEFEN